MKKQIPFHPSDFEEKWQKIWEEKGVSQPDLKKASKPFYNLMMFPYPSAEGLHVGNMYAFTGADIYGRFKRMQGNDVFEPIGLDGFGIHSENYAIKVGRHPKEQAKISAKNFYRQLHAIGNGFAWKNTVETYDPDYYRWTQWIFVTMFKHGLAYRKKSLINFCPSCKTVLSDEQVVKRQDTPGVARRDSPGVEESVSDNVCERCGSRVTKKEMEQWFFKITAFAEKLLQNTYKPSFKWSEKVKVGQRNWIGKKEGINITYAIKHTGSGRMHSPGVKEAEATISCFTTRPDTNFGATFVVVAPEHPFVNVILGSAATPGSQKDSGQSQNDKKMIISEAKLQEIRDYIEKAKKKSEIDRIAEGREKTGVFTGFYAVNQLTNYKMPIYVTDFVLGHVGTGAVVGVPAHDQRDFEFAKKFNLKIKTVVIPGKKALKTPGRWSKDSSQVEESGAAYEEDGIMVNSGFLNGLSTKEAIKQITDHIEGKGWGKRVTTYKLRDWCISRQRYWGAPIPMILCKKCGWVPVPEDQLPVLLPDLDDWKPEGTGKGPLAKLPQFYETTCPKCGGIARRETDVCDTFLDSSWYFLRYPSVESHSGKRGTSASRIRGGSWTSQDDSLLPWDRQITRRWLPVHIYIGGAEHTVLHLLYARFVTMAFKEWGLIDFEEPFSRFYAHGLIIADGAKMSKSRGNIIIPDEYIRKYGADALRTYLMFLGPFDMGGDFRDTGIVGMYRFLSRVWLLVSDVILACPGSPSDSGVAPMVIGVPQNDKLTRVMHRSIKEVTSDLENLRYNTAIAHIMEFVNELQNFKFQISNFKFIKALLLLLAPFAPHMTEELWQRLKNTSDGGPERSRRDSSKVKGSVYSSIHLSPWPSYDPEYLEEDEVEIIVQVNGKLRDTIKVKSLPADKAGQKSKVKSEVEEKAKKSEKVQKYIAGKAIRKVIFVPGKLLNFVV